MSTLHDPRGPRVGARFELIREHQDADPPIMCESIEGEWIQYTDYAAQRDELAKMKLYNTRLQQRVAQQRRNLSRKYLGWAETKVGMQREIEFWRAKAQGEVPTFGHGAKYDEIAHGKQQLATAQERVTELEHLFRLSCSDNLEYLSCQPECNSYGHSEKCAVAYPAIEFNRLNEQVNILQRQLAEALDGLTTAADLYKQARVAFERIEMEALLTADPVAHLSIIYDTARQALATPEPPRGGS